MYYATSHRSAVVFYLSFVQMYVLLNSSSLVVVIFVGVVLCTLSYVLLLLASD